MEKPFIEELQNFFHEYISSIDFNELSPQHLEAAIKISKYCDILKSILPNEGQEALTNFDNAYGELLTQEVEIAYKKGFAEGLEFLFHFF